MPFFEKSGKIYLFVHIPKTGGSSLEAHLSKHTKMFFFCNHRPVPHITRISPQHYPISALKLMFGKEFWKESFSVVRNPFRRLESEYHYQRKYFWPNIDDFNKWVMIALSNYKDNPFYLDYHLKPQTEFIDNTVRVYKYENGLENIRSHVEGFMGIASTEELPRKLSHNKTNIEWSSDAANLVRRVYAQDFQLLKYSEAIPK